MRNNPSTHSYSSTKVFSYSNTGQGEPKYYEATSETTQGPGGVSCLFGLLFDKCLLTYFRPMFPFKSYKKGASALNWLKLS